MREIPLSALRAAGFLLGTALLAAPVSAQDRRPVIAVLPLENGGSYGRDKEDFEALRKGLAAMLISELAVNPELRLVDRLETQRILDQQGLGVADRVDKETVARVGKLAGARYAVTGSFIDLYGDFRIDTRLVDVETGQIIKVARSDPKLHDRRDLYRMLQSVAAALVASPPSGIALPQSAGVTPRSREVPTEAIAHFSKALLYRDRGDPARAAESYQKALELYPDYTEASEGLTSLRRRPPNTPA